ncbi:MAG: transporter substrate-binding domain-containing protein [Bacteriovoracaceae bacterium]|jgi:membrane-bound lytic murein transglycosylase MltF|nr:transporter substrate-binding domain-containing protein [Bacteriovoracaceae bacterium]
MNILLIFFLLLFNLGSFANEGLTDHLLLIKKSGIRRIISEKYFKVLTTKNSFDYYIYQGIPKGIQLEMTKQLLNNINKRYAKKKSSLNIQFEMIPVASDQLIPMLLEGRGDIITAGLTITPNRKKIMNFSMPYRYVDEVIVTRKELADQDVHGKTLHIRKSASYYEAVTRYNKKNKINPFKVETVNETLHTEYILELISLGIFNYTIADSYIAQMAVNIFDNLVILKDRPFGTNLPIGWAVRKENTKLLEEINLVIPTIKKGTKIGNIMNNKYFKDFGGIKARLKSEKPQTLSKYDYLIKKYSKKYQFDWRLISALCYQESRFIQDQENKWGAIGLFQIKQMTANEPYVNIKNISGPKNAENNIHAGIKYLAWIRDRYFEKIPGIKRKEVLRLTIAAYNAGPARVLKAIQMTKEINLDTKKWFRNVEYGMLRLKKVEPVTYVSEISKRYISYVLLGIPK